MIVGCLNDAVSERDTENFLRRQTAANQLITRLHREKWAQRRIVDHRLWPLEVVAIVRVGTAECEYRRESLSLATGASGPLLVVKTLRRHVRQHHRYERADIDAHFHRGGDAQHVDLVEVATCGTLRDYAARRRNRFFVDKEISKMTLPLCGGISLTREFLAVESRKGTTYAGAFDGGVRPESP